MKRLKRLSNNSIDITNIKEKDIVQAFIDACYYELVCITDEDFLYEYSNIKSETSGYSRDIKLTNLFVDYFLNNVGLDTVYDELNENDINVESNPDNDNYIKNVIKNYDKYTDRSIFEELDSTIQEAYDSFYED